MKKIGRLLMASGCVLLLSGCVSPKLAQTPLGPTEKKWAEYLSDAYPEWHPPKTMPPVSETPSALPVLQEQETVPEAPIIEVDSTAVEIKAPVGGFKSAPADAKVIEKVQNEKFDVYVTRKGDSLWKVANKFYKNGSKWRIIYDANRDVMKTPQSLKAGMELRIPVQ